MGRPRKTKSMSTSRNRDRGWSQRSRELLDVRVCFVLRFTFLKEQSGLEGARGDTGSPGGGCYNGPTEK